MNPLVGLDIAKGKSQGQAFLDKGRPHGKSFTVIHTREGLEAFHSFLKHLEEACSLIRQRKHQVCAK
jgi:hypothetical protein